MVRSTTLLLLIPLLALLFPSASYSQCSSNSINSGFAQCVDLQPSTFAWTYFSDNLTASIAYTDTALSTSGWVGWGINFDGNSMVGSNALIAFLEPNGTSTVLRYKLTSTVYDNASYPLDPVSSFDLQVLNMSTMISGTTFTILATLQFSSNQTTTVNQVYNRGPSVTNDVPAPHGTGQRNGMNTVDLSTGSVTASLPPHQQLKNTHGALAAVSWGVLLILGAMSARYLRPFADPAWFYIHIALQSLAYLLGVSAFGIGMKLADLSPGAIHYGHKNLGISITSLASLQMLALFLRPKKDHKFRLYWSIYHHTLGYTVIILGVINIFKGFNILTPPHKYKALYIAFIVVAACASLALEGVTWFHFFRQRREKQMQNNDAYALSSTGKANGAGGRLGTQPGIATAPPKWDNDV